MKVTKPRVPSTATTSKTVRARTAELGEHQAFTSKGETAAQLQNEVKACITAEHELIVAELHKGGAMYQSVLGDEGRSVVSH